MKNNIITLDFEFNNVKYEIIVNGVIVFSDSSSFPVKANININEWVINGSNSVGFRIYPSVDGSNFSKKSKAKIIVSSNELNAPDEESTELEVLQSPEFDEPLDNFELLKDIKMELPNLHWKWLQTETMTDDFGTKNAIIQIYEQIWDSLNDKKIDNYLNMNIEKNSEYALAYYLPINFRINLVKRSFQNKLNDSSFNLIKLNKEELGLHLTANGKLAFLKNAEGNHAICFKESEYNMLVEIPVYICKQKDNSLLIIR